MSKRRILILAGVVALFVLVEVLLPEPLNWTPTYSQFDKNPYGSYVLGQLLPGFLAEEAPIAESITLYEAADMPQPLNILVLADHFGPGEQDVDMLLKRVSNGDQAFIAAHYWDHHFADTLGFSFDFSWRMMRNDEQGKDSLSVRFTQNALPKQEFRFPAPVISHYFDSIPANATVLAKSEDELPVLIALPVGEGIIYLSSTPLLYTNYFLMQHKTRPYAEASLSYLPLQPLLWTEYYHLGRLESRSQLRFILREPALRWGYYLSIGILLSFVVISLKRRQRAIPVVEPPANTSLLFAQTLARLYYSQGDHCDIALKKISYFKEWLREHYQMPAGPIDEQYLERLIRKSGKSEAQVRALFQYIGKIEQQSHLLPQDLLELEQKIDAFIRK